ncbi:hypothetical protein RIR_jg28239.t1 [Rhizophagus irregularis DAOM 181602=DAOM 197198]|nr:hypothetical protein RIR_jg28239.t1 [Rhizophagus irregularis DAOM 181602=DAOM 197198]
MSGYKRTYEAEDGNKSRVNLVNLSNSILGLLRIVQEGDNLQQNNTLVSFKCSLPMILDNFQSTERNGQHRLKKWKKFRIIFNINFMVKEIVHEICGYVKIIPNEADNRLVSTLI